MNHDEIKKRARELYERLWSDAMCDGEDKTITAFAAFGQSIAD